jgi:cysteinyl-tRNA synthetase
MESSTPSLNQTGEGYQALLDDLNTPMAISELHRIAKKMHSAQGIEQQTLQSELLGLAGLMGLLQQDPESWFTHARGSDDITKEEVEEMIAKRQQSKIDKDYAGADEIRQALLDRGVVLEDSREGTTWRRS